MTSFLLHSIVAALVTIDPCALLTQAEAEAILGAPIAPPQPGRGGECRYAAESGRGEIMIQIMALGFRSEEEFHAFVVEDTRRMNERMQESMRGTGATVKETTVDPVSELGSPAYFVDPTLVVLKDGRVLNVLAEDRQQAVAVAAKALPRLK